MPTSSFTVSDGQRMRVNDEHEQLGSDNEDSLFGSPPPSPARGRSPQLALPTGPGARENVGTIALPGSQYYSELPLNPAAVLLNTPHPSDNGSRDTPRSSLVPPHPGPMPIAMPSAIRPTAPPIPLMSQSQQPISSLPFPIAPHPSSAVFDIPTVDLPDLMSRAPSTRGPSCAPSGSMSRAVSRASRKTQRTRTQSSVPRPTPPPIPLPHPDAPLPSNFLRSQQHLLGTAGLVGKVNPATLKHHDRGASAYNPIVVEDDYDPPSIGQGRRDAIDASRLPPPPGEEIIASLVKQKNIFPVLESILRLLSGAQRPVQPQVSAFFRRESSSSQSEESDSMPKRRKLSHVPAGAADWDVPYPFAEGEGPEHYRIQWEKERIKRLLAQLVGLVKGATRNAAARTYMQRYGQYLGGLAPGHPRDHPAGSLVRAGSPRTQGQEEFRDITNTRSSAEPSTSTQPPPPPCTPTGLSDTATWDSFISTLLGQMAANSSTQTDSSRSSSDRGQSNETGSESPSPFDITTSPEFDDLMAMFQDNSLPASGWADPVSSHLEPYPEPPVTTERSVSSTPAINIPYSAGSTFADAMIDPDLLALSIPSGDVQSFGDQTPSGIAAPATPTLVQSPEASMASFGGPPTPQCDEMHPEPTIHTGEPEPARASAPTAPGTSFQRPDFSCVQMLPAQQSPHFPPPHPQALSTPPLPYPMSSGSTPVPAPSAAFASTARLLSVLDSKRVAQGSARGTNKQDIIRRAKERRAQLQAELERAKVELWETTIEQGALAHIAKDTAVM